MPLSESAERVTNVGQVVEVVISGRSYVVDVNGLMELGKPAIGFS